MELPLAIFFVKQLLHKGAELNDLATLDAELYKNLMFLNSYEGDVEDLALTYTISKDVGGVQQEASSYPFLSNIFISFQTFNFCDWKLSQL